MDNDEKLLECARKIAIIQNKWIDDPLSGEQCQKEAIAILRRLQIEAKMSEINEFDTKNPTFHKEKRITELQSELKKLDEKKVD